MSSVSNNSGVQETFVCRRSIMELLTGVTFARAVDEGIRPMGYRRATMYGV